MKFDPLIGFKNILTGSLSWIAFKLTCYTAASVIFVHYVFGLAVTWELMLISAIIYLLLAVIADTLSHFYD